MDEEKLLGMGAEIEFEGKQWRMASLTYELQAKFVAWLKRRAVDAVREQKSYLDPDEYAAKMDKVDQNIAAGVYGFGGEVCVKSSKSIDGLKELVRIALAKNHPEVNHEFVDRLFETKIDEAARVVKRANSGPLPPTPPPNGVAAD